MSVKEEHHCRLCLKVAKDESEIDENMKQIFEILSLKLDLDITRDPIICQDCMIVSKKCLDFKDTCISTEEFILLYSADRNNVKLDIKDIYEEREHTRTLFDEDFNICRLCMTRMERIYFTPLDVLTNESMFEMLSQYMAETDFNSIENPLVCANCKEKMNDYFKFVLSCQDIEGKIKAYCERRGSDDVGQVELSNVLLFMFTDVLEYSDNSSPTYKVEQEPTEVLYPEAHINLIKHEEVDIKDEEMAEIDLQKNADRFFPKEYDKETKSEMICLNSGEHITEGFTYKKNIQENIMEDCLFDGDVLEPKSNEIRETGINNTDGIFIDETKQKEHVKGDLANDSYAVEADTYQNTLYTFEAKQRGVLKKRATTCKVASRPKRKHKVNKQMLIPEISSDIQNYISIDGNIVPLYKCSLCAYESYRKSNLTSHMLVHKDGSEIKMYKCSFCAYQAKNKSSLNVHMVVHKDVSEIKMYKCSFCTYKAKRKSNITEHMLVHKDVSEVNMYKCFLCDYEAKRKDSLKSHMLVHKDVSEINMYKCSFCAYESKRKRGLTSHMLVHKDVSEIYMYKCSFCLYEAKNISNLKVHMGVHKDISERKVYKCSLCTHESKRKANLKPHMLVHKDVSEIKMYKCTLCAYEGKRKNNLEAHMLVHKDVSEIKMYKCALCAYEAKRKQYLEKHMLVHKDVSEIKMNKCSFCTYEAKHKSSLVTHMLVHKDASEINMYKCSLCDFETKRKGSLTIHMLVHKDVLEINMYKCALCPYEVKNKKFLIKHMSVHRKLEKLCTYEAKQESILKKHILD